MNRFVSFGVVYLNFPFSIFAIFKTKRKGSCRSSPGGGGARLDKFKQKNRPERARKNKPMLLTGISQSDNIVLIVHEWIGAYGGGAGVKKIHFDALWAAHSRVEC